MRPAFMLAAVTVLSVAGAFARDLPDDVVREPHRVVGKGNALTTDSTQTSPINEIWVTAGNQILVELTDDEATRPNLFDLNGRTLVFTPDGQGRYLREVRALEWEEESGEAVTGYRPVIMLENFDFPFAGQRWDSFYLGPPGVLTFGGPFNYSIPRLDITIQEIANEFISTPTISVLYKPHQSDVYARHVVRRTDRIVVTWITVEPIFYVHGVRPEKPARFQTVLSADGSIKFSYIDVPFGNGIVGLFQGGSLTPEVDLSQSDSLVASGHHEAFHYRSRPDTTEIVCHLIGMLGEAFDLFVFHSEFRMDTQRVSTPWSRWAFNEQGSGRTFDKYEPCGEGRLKGHWFVPIWIKSLYVVNASPSVKEDEGFDRGLWLFAHEFAHSWLAYYEYDKSGQRERLNEYSCYCHWRWDLHTPAVFPWHAEDIRFSSIMGGQFWFDHGNGRFTLHGTFEDGGFSWLDLYAMGLADADEVPDMFIIRNLQRVDDPGSGLVYTGEKEIISIDQIVSAEGPRVPGRARSQKVFNAGFIYLLEPGQTPSGDLLDLHARYRDRAVEYWSHITGGRSQITTVVPQLTNNPPRSQGTIPAPPLTEEGMAVEVDVRDYFSDPDGDPLTYEATSSDDEVAEAGMSGSIVTIKPGAAGTATVTVTAKDGRGGLAYQTIAIVVNAEPEENPTDFTFVPVILSAEGRNHALFTSELTLTHRGTEQATLDFTYTAHAGGGSGIVRDYLEPGRQLIIPDAIEFLRERGLPIPATGNRIGTLRVAFPRLASSDMGITVRTTTAVPGGRVGLAYAGVPVEAGFDDSVFLCGLRQNEQDRSNVAFQHMGTPDDGPITLRTTVYSGDAEISEGHVLEERILVPGGFYQYNGILNMVGFDNGYVKVERVEGTAPFYAYGVINDQANSDGSFVFPVTASSLEGKTGQTLPVIVETRDFTSELTVTSFSQEPRTLNLEFVSEQIKGNDKRVEFSMELEAGEQGIIPELVEALRREEMAKLGTSRGYYLGPLFVTAIEGDLSGIVVGARTGSKGGGGQSSVFYDAVPEGEAFTREAWVEGLQQNEENRSNLALVNTGAVDDSDSVFRIDIYDGETGALVRGFRRTVPAQRWRQINSILRNETPATTQGYVQIRMISGNNPFLAYGVVNDGGAPGERSGDGAYLPARE